MYMYMDYGCCFTPQPWLITIHPHTQGGCINGQVADLSLLHLLHKHPAPSRHWHDFPKHSTLHTQRYNWVERQIFAPRS